MSLSYPGRLSQKLRIICGVRDGTRVSQDIDLERRKSMGTFGEEVLLFFVMCLVALGAVATFHIGYLAGQRFANYAVNVYRNAKEYIKKNSL